MEMTALQAVELEEWREIERTRRGERVEVGFDSEVTALATRRRRRGFIQRLDGGASVDGKKDPEEGDYPEVRWRGVH